MLSPIIDFTASKTPSHFMQGMQYNDTQQNAGGSPTGGSSLNNSMEKQIMPKTTATKRSVSETKKKYVASIQNWKCEHCNNQLNAWFEVDHKVRLEHGGSNDVANLVALCRDCHGKKTAFENM